MAAALRPSNERFDPITGLWTNPDGPLPDPQRKAVDPGGLEPVTLVDPVPSELADPAGASETGSGVGAGTVARLTPTQRLRRAIVALLIAAAAIVVVALLAGPLSSVFRFDLGP